MATEEVPVTKESLEEKVSDLKIQEPEKLEDKTEAPVAEAPVAETPEEAKEPTKEDDVVKAEVPAEELKSEHDIAPPAEETPTSTVETVATETGPEKVGESAPADVDEKPPSKVSSIGDKISSKLHKVVGKD